jgi:hypothetical protein
MENLIEVGSLIKHLLSGDICKVLKINDKTYKVSRLRKGYTTIYEDVLVKKSDCEFYIEPPKVKSPYEIYRERVVEGAAKLPPLPKETDQSVLWLKMMIVEKVDTAVEKNPDLYTFRRKETDESSKFGFSEQYVNLLMQMAYDAGHKRASDDLTSSYNRSTDMMKAALNKIKDALDDADWIDYPEFY